MPIKQRVFVISEGVLCGRRVFSDAQSQRTHDDVAFEGFEI